MVAIKEMSMPKYCNDCDFVIDSMGYCERANEQIPNYDFYSETNEKPDFCPLIEIEERKAGKWIKDCETPISINYHCSECGSSIQVFFTNDKDNKKLKCYPFCHCGAEMRGAENE